MGTIIGLYDTPEAAKLTPPGASPPKTRRTAPRLLAVALLLGAGSWHPAQAQIEKWQRGVLSNELIFENPPFPESHAATIAETPTGLVAAWMGGTRERAPDVGIWVSRYQRGTWTPPVEVANGVATSKLRYPTGNPVLYQAPNGELLLFYKIGPRPADWQGWLRTSNDGGQTWSAARPLPPGYAGPTKNKPLLLKNGQLLCPSSTDDDQGGHLHFEATPDLGQTWTKIGPLDNATTLGGGQPSLLTYKDGRLQALAASRDCTLVESWSADQGLTWSPLASIPLPSNNSGTDAVTLADGRQLLVYNHVLPAGPLTKAPRTPLNVAVSKDGKTWFAAVILEDSPGGPYSYPSVIQSKDGLVHIVYAWQRKGIKHAVLDPKKLNLVKMKKGAWPALDGYKAPAGEAEAPKE